MWKVIALPYSSVCICVLKHFLFLFYSSEVLHVVLDFPAHFLERFGESKCEYLDIWPSKEENDFGCSPFLCGISINPSHLQLLYLELGVQERTERGGEIYKPLWYCSGMEFFMLRLAVVFRKSLMSGGQQINMLLLSLYEVGVEF